MWGTITTETDDRTAERGCEWNPLCRNPLDRRLSQMTQICRPGRTRSGQLAIKKSTHSILVTGKQCLELLQYRLQMTEEEAG